ncbi:hypothetical protein GO497_07330 [Acidovorax citrulli]|nr:hypothetical protein [Paracidovorax citrulli]
MEHAAALLHPLFGRAVRAGLPGAQSIMPSTAKRVGPAPCWTCRCTMSWTRGASIISTRSLSASPKRHCRRRSWWRWCCAPVAARWRVSHRRPERSSRPHSPLAPPAGRCVAHAAATVACAIIRRNKTAGNGVGVKEAGIAARP